MQRTKQLLLCLALFGVSIAGAAAQDNAKLNDTLLKATAPFEDMVGPALAGDGKGIAKLLAKVDKEADAVKKVLPADAATHFDKLSQALHKAAAARDGLALAQNAVQLFRLLVDNLKTDELKIPIEVSMLDWAGYQLLVLAAAEKPDWEAMRKVADDADKWWKGIAKSKVTEKNLRATVTTALAGLHQATQEKNLSMAKFGAQVTLDLVDLLERHFKAKK
jgi:hypothetical protein